MRTGSASFSSTPVRRVQDSPGRPHRRTAQEDCPRAGAGKAPVLCRTDFLCVGLIHLSAWKWNSANFTLMELGIFAREPPEYLVRGFTEGERKPRAVPSLYRALALLCRLWANFAITEFSEDEMRRPTPRYAVPLEGLQVFDGL